LAAFGLDKKKNPQLRICYMMDHEDKDLDAIITINLYYHRSVQIVEILNKAFHGIGRLTIDVCSVKIIKKLSQAGLEAF
jgi:hypothetical protein